MGEPSRILLVGDMHGNTAAALAVIDYAAELGADRIVQLGDFGFWPGDSFLPKTSHRLQVRGLTLDWIDGNHEQHDKLRRLPMQPDGTQWLRDTHGDYSPVIRHLPRGFRWHWGDTIWLAVGGAVSTDQQVRTPGVDWFPDEELTDEQADVIMASGPADVIVAHDAPWGVAVPARRAPALELLKRSDGHQRRIRRIVEGVGAAALFHGHHHVRYSDTLAAAHGEVQVEGLAMDLDPLESRCLLVDSSGRTISW